LAILFRHAQLFIFPSLYEGFGFPVLEAMSCGCPVITSNAGSLAEVAADGAQTFDPSDVRGMAEAIKTLLRDPDESECWRQRGLNRARDFSWEKTAEQTISVYQRAYRQLSAHSKSLTSVG
jgi:glycosyltransferase involved in cell wall biosynthesis